jgi:hypothetical protein
VWRQDLIFVLPERLDKPLAQLSLEEMAEKVAFRRRELMHLRRQIKRMNWKGKAKAHAAFRASIRWRRDETLQMIDALNLHCDPQRVDSRYRSLYNSGIDNFVKMLALEKDVAALKTEIFAAPLDQVPCPPPVPHNWKGPLPEWAKITIAKRKAILEAQGMKAPTIAER